MTNHSDQQDHLLEELLVKARQGDKTAEAQMLQKLIVRFRWIAERRVGTEDGQDLAQEACAVVISKYKSESFDPGKTGRNFAAWANKILQNKILAFRAKASRHGQVVVTSNEASEFTAGATTEPDLRRAILDCLAQVGKRSQRYADILLLFAQGYTTTEVCERLAIKPNNAYQILDRGRKSLQACLGRKGYAV